MSELEIIDSTEGEPNPADVPKIEALAAVLLDISNRERFAATADNFPPEYARDLARQLLARGVMAPSPGPTGTAGEPSVTELERLYDSAFQSPGPADGSHVQGLKAVWRAAAAGAAPASPAVREVVEIERLRAALGEIRDAYFTPLHSQVMYDIAGRALASTEPSGASPAVREAAQTGPELRPEISEQIYRDAYALALRSRLAEAFSLIASIAYGQGLRAALAAEGERPA